MEKTKGLSVSESVPQSAGTTDHSENGVVCGPRSGPPRRDSEEGLPSHAATLLGDASSRTRNMKTIQVLLGHVDLEATTIYLHLSHPHLQAVNNPIETLPIAGLGPKLNLRKKKGE